MVVKVGMSKSVFLLLLLLLLLPVSLFFLFPLSFPLPPRPPLPPFPCEGRDGHLLQRGRTEEGSDYVLRNLLVSGLGGGGAGRRRKKSLLPSIQSLPAPSYFLWRSVAKKRRAFFPFLIGLPHPSTLFLFPPLLLPPPHTHISLLFLLWSSAFISPRKKKAFCTARVHFHSSIPIS